MRILVVDDCCSIAAKICQAYRELGIEVMEEEAPVPEAREFPYEPRNYPASCREEKVRDWVQPRNKNQYKQKRRGKR